MALSTWLGKPYWESAIVEMMMIDCKIKVVSFSGYFVKMQEEVKAPSAQTPGTINQTETQESLRNHREPEINLNTLDSRPS